MDKNIRRTIKRTLNEYYDYWEYIPTPEELEGLLTKNVKSGNNLVIHPNDRTTDFLYPSYANISATVLHSKADMYNLRENMKQHDRIIMMGHGTPNGLLMPVGSIKGVEEINGDVKEYTQHSINSSFVDILKTKPIVAVWCNADRFVVPHDLHGFYTGMVVSEMCEADYCNVRGCDVDDLEESNRLFTIALTAAIDIPSPESVNVFKEIYNNPKNQIMLYNRQRIYYR